VLKKLNYEFKMTSYSRPSKMSKTIPYTLEFFAQHAINRRPTLHDIIHYVAWMGYIQETKYYPSTCLEAANNIEFAFANSRATYGKTQSTRLHAVCANAWSSQYTLEQQVWARTTEDHARWGTIHYEPNSWKRTWNPINVKQAKYDVEWRQTRVLNLMALAAAYAKNNLADVINQINTKGYSALHAAVFSGNLELVKLLLDAGAYPEGDLPLVYDDPPSVAEDAEVIVIPTLPPPRRALQPAHRSANILQPFLGRRTSLTVAIQEDHGHIVSELIRRGHRMDLTDFRAGRTPLQLAISCNKLNSVKALLSAGASPKGSLFHALKINYTDCEPMMRLLCNAGADPNETNEQNRTPLMVAALARPIGFLAYGNKLENTIKSLIKLGALVDMQDMLGQTALHLAAIRDNEDKIKELLDCNINTQLVDNFGNRAIDVAEDDDIKILIARAELKKRFKGSKQTRR